MEVGKSDLSAPFGQVLELLCANNEYLAFAPDTSETRLMINLLSIKFPLLKVCLIFLFEYPSLQTSFVRAPFLSFYVALCAQVGDSIMLV